jgi:hypothetical protein
MTMELDTTDIDRMRSQLGAMCDGEVQGAHIALARSHFDAAAFHLRLHREQMAVAAGELKNGDMRRIGHDG